MNKFIKLHSSKELGVELLFRVDMIELVVQSNDKTRVRYSGEIYEVEETLDDILEMVRW